jgi:lipopolysaccharide assembly protein A
MRVLVWLARAFIFFTLFAFALNNQHEATVHWFFGVQWRSPMVLVVLAAFALGVVLGVLALLPGVWRRRRVGIGALQADSSQPPAATLAPPSSAYGVDPPPRVGL